MKTKLSKGIPCAKASTVKPKPMAVKPAGAVFVVLGCNRSSTTSSTAPAGMSNVIRLKLVAV